MATGIVSIALALDRRETASRVLLALAALAWIGLGIVVLWRVIRDRRSLVAEARSPAGLTAIAATAVLGARLVALGWSLAAALLLILAVLAWPILMSLVLACLVPNASGDWFMLTVATEGLASLACALAVQEKAGWLLHVGLALAAAGVLLYPLVLVRFRPRELARGCGEHWVAGGSLAISALAFAQMAIAGRRLHLLHDAMAALSDIALVLWVTAMLWLVPLVVCELLWPRLRYHSRRWSTVFPLGMYAVCSFDVAAATRTPLIGDFARGWVWVPAAGWIVVFLGMVGRGSRLVWPRDVTTKPR